MSGVVLSFGLSSRLLHQISLAQMKMTMVLTIQNFTLVHPVSHLEIYLSKLSFKSLLAWSEVIPEHVYMNLLLFVSHELMSHE